MSQDQQPSTTSDQAAASNAISPEIDPIQRTSTTVARRWIRKSMIFLLIFLVLGFWGLYDAVILYPNRGKDHVQHMTKAYLDQAQRASRLVDASVGDPASVLAELRDRPVTSMSDLDRAKLEWLTSLSRVQMLTPANTTFPDPAGKLDTLKKDLAGKDQPKPLAGWDIPFQWFITVVGFLGAIWVLFNIARTKAKVYRWDPATSRLTLPSGTSLVPADITEFDKRKWHKFFVTLVTTRGDRHELDLYKYEPLEEWILAMEDIRFPEVPEGIEPPTPSATADTQTASQ